MFTPFLVDDTQDGIAFNLAHDVGRNHLLFTLVERCSGLEKLVRIFFDRVLFKLVAFYFEFDRKFAQHLFFEPGDVCVWMVFFNDFCGVIVQEVENICCQTFLDEGVTAPFVDHFALLIENVIVFKQAFSNGKVLFFNLFLGTLY